MNVPQENSPVVNAPNTRSGGGSSDFMSATCAVISRCKKSRISRSSSAVRTCCAPDEVCASKLLPAAMDPSRQSPIRPVLNRIARINGLDLCTPMEIACRCICLATVRSAYAARANANLPASSTVRRRALRREGERHSRGAKLPAEFGRRLPQELDTDQSATARCARQPADSERSELDLQSRLKGGIALQQ